MLAQRDLLVDRGKVKRKEKKRKEKKRKKDKKFHRIVGIRKRQSGQFELNCTLGNF